MPLDSETLARLEQAILQNPGYRLAENDPDLLTRDELRSVRLQLEFLKPELIMHEHRIRSTVVVFGSARILSPHQARTGLNRLLEERKQVEPGPQTALLDRKIHKAERQLHYSRFYDEARRFAELVSCQFQQNSVRDYVVITGGGPGIMMAANQGAFDVGCESIGLNITLPHEQVPNPYMTPELAFRFHYFALRKMHFMHRARALIAFPGGFGTLDELLEALTLVQTGKVEPIPIILFGQAFWEKTLNLPFLVEEGMIDARDAQLITYVEKAEQAVDILKAFYGSDFTVCPCPAPAE
jgi:hypothetical protein